MSTTIAVIRVITPLSLPSHSRFDVWCEYDKASYLDLSQQGLSSHQSSGVKRDQPGQAWQVTWHDSKKTFNLTKNSRARTRGKSENVVCVHVLLFVFLLLCVQDLHYFNLEWSRYSSLVVLPRNYILTILLHLDCKIFGSSSLFRSFFFVHASFLFRSAHLFPQSFSPLSHTFTMPPTGSTVPMEPVLRRF